MRCLPSWLVMIVVLSFGAQESWAGRQLHPPPIAYWPFDTDAQDAFGDHDGTLVGSASINAVETAPVPDNGGSLQVVGGGYVSIANSGDFSYSGLGAEFTISFWARPTSNTPTHVLGKRSGCTGNTDINYQLGFEPGVIEIRTGNAFRETHPSALNGTTFAHVAISHDATGEFRYYENGSLVASGVNVPMDQANPGDLRIGTSGTCDAIEGFIDELAIYDRALAPSEIGFLAAQAVPTAHSPLLPGVLLCTGAWIARRRATVRGVSSRKRDDARVVPGLD